jgi:hypothetical protein
MILYLLSFFDFCCAILIYMGPYLPKKIMLYAILYLIIKGLFFGYNGDFLSWIDFLIGIYLIFVMFGITSYIISLLAFFYLMQKILMIAIR